MKKVFLLILFLSFSFLCFCTEEPQEKPKILLLIAEQNINSPQRAWWASEVDLSTVESTLAKILIENGYEVLEPDEVNDVIKANRAFRVINLSEEKSIKLAKTSGAYYVIVGKAVASSGNKVLNSNMVSCFANINAKVIRIKDNKVLGYPSSSSSSAHLDPITGGREALEKAGQDLAIKVVDILNKNK